MTENDLMLAIEASLANPEFKARLLALLGRQGLLRVPKSATVHYRIEAGC